MFYGFKRAFTLENKSEITRTFIRKRIIIYSILFEENYYCVSLIKFCFLTTYFAK